MRGLPYKDTFAAKGSDLYKALTEAPPDTRDALAKKIYTETGDRMRALTPKEKTT